MDITLLTITLITISIVLILCIVFKFVKINKDVTKILWIALPLAWWIYYISVGYFPPALDKNSDIQIQKILLTDFCPFASVIIPPLMIFKKTRKIAFILAPWIIISGGVTLFDSINSTYENFSMLRVIFYGGPKGELFFLKHLMLIVLGIILLFNYKIIWIKNKNKIEIVKLFFWNIILMFGYLMYVLIVKESLHLVGWTTGIGEYDWLHGQYSIASDFLNIHTYPKVMLIAFTILTIVDLAILLATILIQYTYRSRLTRVNEIQKA